MDKELTYFIVDLSPSMGEKNSGRDKTDLEYGLEYLFDVIAQKLLRAKKLDQVSVIGLHHPETENPLATEDENTNIKILSKMQPASFDLLRTLKKELKENHQTFSKTEGDIIKALLVAFTMAYEQTRSTKKATYNFVIISNCKSEMEIDEQLGGHVATILASCNNAKIHVASIDFNHYDENDLLKRDNESKWKNLFDEVNNGSSIFAFDELLSISQDLSRAIPRLVRPVRTFDGELRFGCDLDAIDENHFLYRDSSVGEDVDPRYDQNVDPVSLCMRVEGYPFIKKEGLMSAKTFTVVETEGELYVESMHPVKFIKDYKVEDVNSQDEENKTRSVSLAETMNVFKYGTSMTPLTQDLEKMAKFRTFPGIDIRGIIRLNELPECYLTEESMIIVSKGSIGSQRDVTNFNSLCSALINLRSVAIVRYVLKLNAEVNMGALIPTLINADKLLEPKKRAVKDEDDESQIKEAYCFALVRLPFKEDEKISNFNSLSRVIENKLDEKYANYIPDQKMIDMMVEYIEEADMDKEDVKRHDDEKFLTPTEYEFSLPVPYNLTHLHRDVESGRLNEVTAGLIHPSPGIHILQSMLRKLIIEVCPDKEEEEELSLGDFILRNQEKVDQIIDDYNSQLSIKVAQPVVDENNEIVKKLSKLLENQPVKQEGRKKGRYDDDEVMVKNEDGDDDFDIEQILAAGK